MRTLKNLYYCTTYENLQLLANHNKYLSKLMLVYLHTLMTEIKLGEEGGFRQTSKKQNKADHPPVTAKAVKVGTASSNG